MVMAADVLAGNDEHCAAWIRANRDSTDGEAAPPAAGAAAAQPGRGPEWARRPSLRGSASN